LEEAGHTPYSVAIRYAVTGLYVECGMMIPG